MPIYEYRCPQCGQEFDKLVRMDADAREIECPHCGHKGVDKKVSLFGMGGGDTFGSFASAPPPSCGTSGGT